MPETISETILQHHEPDKAEYNRFLAHLVYVADLTSTRFVLGHDLDKMDTAHLRSSLDAIEFDTLNLPELLASASFNAFAFTNCL
jgi:hypothetical protein